MEKEITVEELLKRVEDLERSKKSECPFNHIPSCPLPHYPPVYPQTPPWNILQGPWVAWGGADPNIKFCCDNKTSVAG